MKKIVIALSAFVILAAAVVFVVKAQDTKPAKKTTTEVTSVSKCCASTTAGMSMKDCKPDGSCSKSANSKAKCDSAKCKMNGGDKVQPMSCCKGKVESTTTSQTGCTSSCTMMKSKSESK